MPAAISTAPDAFYLEHLYCGEWRAASRTIACG